MLRLPADSTVLSAGSRNIVLTNSRCASGTRSDEITNPSSSKDWWSCHFSFY